MIHKEPINVVDVSVSDELLVLGVKQSLESFKGKFRDPFPSRDGYLDVRVRLNVIGDEFLEMEKAKPSLTDAGSQGSGIWSQFTLPSCAHSTLFFINQSFEVSASFVEYRPYAYNFTGQFAEVRDLIDGSEIHTRELVSYPELNAFTSGIPFASGIHHSISSGKESIPTSIHVVKSLKKYSSFFPQLENVVVRDPEIIPPNGWEFWYFPFKIVPISVKRRAEVYHEAYKNRSLCNPALLLDGRKKLVIYRHRANFTSFGASVFNGFTNHGGLGWVLNNTEIDRSSYNVKKVDNTCLVNFRSFFNFWEGRSVNLEEINRKLYDRYAR